MSTTHKQDPSVSWGETEGASLNSTHTHTQSHSMYSLYCVSYTDLFSPIIAPNKVSANMQSAARQCVRPRHINTQHTEGEEGGGGYFLPSVKAHLSQLLFLRRTRGRKGMRFTHPSGPSPFLLFKISFKMTRWSRSPAPTLSVTQLTAVFCAPRIICSDSQVCQTDLYKKMKEIPWSLLDAAN